MDAHGGELSSSTFDLTFSNVRRERVSYIFKVSPLDMSMVLSGLVDMGTGWSTSYWLRSRGDWVDDYNVRVLNQVDTYF